MPPKPKKKRSISKAMEQQFARQVTRAGLPRPTREHVFHEPKEGEKQRKWRFDFAWIKEKIAVEIEGGVWSRGRHVQPAGYEADREKYGNALAQGWKVLSVTSKMVRNRLGISLLKRVFGRVANHESAEVACCHEVETCFT